MVQTPLVAIAAVLSIASSVVGLPLVVSDVDGIIEAREVSADLEERHDNILEARMMRKITSELIPEIGKEIYTHVGDQILHGGLKVPAGLKPKPPARPFFQSPAVKQPDPKSGLGTTNRPSAIKPEPIKMPNMAKNPPQGKSLMDQLPHDWNKKPSEDKKPSLAQAVEKAKTIQDLKKPLPAGNPTFDPAKVGKAKEAPAGPAKAPSLTAKGGKSKEAPL